MGHTLIWVKNDWIFHIFVLEACCVEVLPHFTLYILRFLREFTLETSDDKKKSRYSLKTMYTVWM